MTPRTLDELRKVRGADARALAAKEYIAHALECAAEARKIRDAAVAEYRQEHSISKTAEACGVSETVVKAVKR